MAGRVAKRRVAEKGKGEPALTEYKVVRRFKNVTLVDILMYSRRTHQIRGRFSSIGHPLFGNGLYGARKSKGFVKSHSPQSYYLEFPKPFSKEKMKFELPASEKILKAVKFAEKGG